MHDSIDTLPRPRRHGVLRRRVAGVTLLVLMAVVLVIGVLGVIAIPSYRQYSMRAQRTDAKAALLRLATNQERFYLDNRRYGDTDDLAALGFPDGLSENGAYRLTVVADTQTFTATATPVAGGAFDMQADEECASFTLTSTGERTADPDPNQRCW